MPKKELLSYEEMERVVRIMAKMGISKVRITGGEPFLRKGMMAFIERLNSIQGIQAILSFQAVKGVGQVFRLL